jgi:peptide/nickel transport system substrate-binding protein
MPTGGIDGNNMKRGVLMKKWRLLGLSVVILALLASLACGSDDTETAPAATAAPAAKPAAKPAAAPAATAAPAAKPAAKPAPVAPAAPTAPTTAPLFNGSFDWDSYGLPKPTTYSESPIFAAQVAAGTLPPVEERLPIAADVLVLPVIDGIGEYGGTWRRAFTGPNDGQNADRIMSDHILHFDLNGTDLIQNVAKGWDMSADGLTYTLYLREGLKWSDGVEATADEWVWYSENVLLNEELNPGRDGQIGWSGFAPSVSKVDKYTVQLTLEERGDAFIDELGTYKTGGYTLHGRSADGLFGPMHFLKTKHRDFADDKAAYDKMVKDAGFDAWPLYFKEQGDPLRSLSVPVISPWKMTSPITANIYEWERNPYYHAVDPVGNQLPYIDRISMQLTGDKEVLNLRAIAGEIDFQHRHIEMAKVPVFLENAEKNNYSMRMWNSHNAQAGIAVNNTYGLGEPKAFDADPEIQKWLFNKDFRIALSMAIDRQRINEVVFLGLGKLKQNTYIKGHPFYPGEDYELKYTAQDIAGANALLDGIGLVDTDGNGIRNRSDGKGDLVIEFVYIAEYFLDYESIAQLSQEDFAKIGIKTFLKAEDVALFTERRADSAHQLLVDGGDQREPISMRAGRSAWWAYGNWYNNSKKVTGIGDPAASPMSDPIIARVVELTDMSQQQRYADRADVYIELQQLNIDNMWFIGIAGDTAAFNGVIVMKNNLKNVPMLAPNQSALQNPGIGRTQTWYFEGGKNDSE